MQTKKNNAQGKGKGKTRQLRLPQRRLEDPTTGTLDTPAESLRSCPNLRCQNVELTKATVPNRLSPAPQRSPCPSEISHCDRGGERKGALLGWSKSGGQQGREVSLGIAAIAPIQDRAMGQGWQQVCNNI